MPVGPREDQKLKFTVGDVRSYPFQRYFDERGWLGEVFRNDETLIIPSMGYISITYPNVTRGPHEHHKQTDHFVFTGPSDFEIIVTDHFGNSLLIHGGASNPIHVIVPPGVIHQYRNIGSVPGLVLNFPDELYKGVGKQEAVDEIRYEVPTTTAGGSYGSS